jgi:hypothetical protein
VRIAYCGNFEPAWSTENHLKRSLEALGHTVIPYQENGRETERLIGAGYYDALYEIDLWLYTRTWKLPGNALEWIRNCPVPTVSYHLDLYAGLSRGQGIERDPFWNTKYVFTPDGGSQRFFEDRGINHFYLRPGVVADECIPGNYDSKYACDVAFVGSENYHHEWPYRKRLINWLRSEYGSRFGLFGSDGKSIRGKALNDLYATAKICIGDSLCLGFNHPGYFSDRVFETTGRGGFIIHPWIKGLDECFTDQEHLSFYRYNDFDGLRQRIDYYLANPEEQGRIRLAGHKHTKANHTYTHRCAEMLRVVAEQEQMSKSLTLGVRANPNPNDFAEWMVIVNGLLKTRYDLTVSFGAPDWQARNKMLSLFARKLTPEQAAESVAQAAIPQIGTSAAE